MDFKSYSQAVNKMMNNYLSNLNVLYTKIRNFHYNIVGVEFFELHEKFEEYYNMVEKELDEVAERILMLEGKPLASLKAYLEHCEIKELESKDITFKDSCKLLRDDFLLIHSKAHELIKFCGDNDDFGTADLFTRNIQNYEKALWMLGALIK